MVKVLTGLAFLLIWMIFPLSAAPNPTGHCRSIINEMVVECLPYFVNHNNSQPQDPSCCSAVQYVVATASGCICDSIMDMENLPLDVIKSMKLSTVCGVLFPCELDVSAASKIETSLEYLSELSSTAQPSYAPNLNSDAPTPAPIYAPNYNSEAPAPAPIQEPGKKFDVVRLIPFFGFYFMVIIMQVCLCARGE
ncbi:hypothetical protein KIW84_041596 [Lathyrus oleraceus]|uniref:Bifunctional inhibitor/plant lipid transfer protein/seed storage helical domain-containing protein n=1 Tax=Pisum sativum TaxID=3888 RepID=A0A9D4XBZ9_PEA|nr:hypothetical protein KIW84_041596 [Pisum sativum]